MMIGLQLTVALEHAHTALADFIVAFGACSATPPQWLGKGNHAALTSTACPINSFHKHDADEETILRSVTMGEEF